MPKFGLKCFLGSFILSLVAVVAATKAYFVLHANTQNEEKTLNLAQTETKTIELFAANEEIDPILEKYDELMRQENIVEKTTDVAEQENEDETIIAAADASAGDSVLFAPEDEQEQTAENSLPIVDAAVLSAVEAEETSESATQTAQTEEFNIVDAAEATVFEIPLVHNFAPESDAVKVSDKAETNQLALATDDVPVENLGATSKPSVQMAQNDMPDDDPWEVAEVANKNAARNQNAEIKDMSATGNNVPYKMQKNILIPIPDEIANDENLTPQFSSSKENIKLEEELRRKHGRPPLRETDKEKSSSTSSAGEKTVIVDEDEISDKDNGSLTDSIAAWFSGGRKSTDNEDKDGDKSDSESRKSKSGQQESSLFRKLLGLGAASNDNISPTELKLAFQPNRAEISGQTLEWIRAFSENVVKYDDVAIEIRLDRNASYELQQKRLNLLYKILANNGVQYQKINIIFTDREPNSFIIRNVRYVTKEEKMQVTEKRKSPWY